MEIKLSDLWMPPFKFGAIFSDPGLSGHQQLLHYAIIDSGKNNNVIAQTSSKLNAKVLVACLNAQSATELGG